jgi:hypothetical protein
MRCSRPVMSVSPTSPTALPWRSRPGPAITCGGIFDPALRSYLSNVVVYAAAAGW